jgi:hypothetical protein
MFILLIAEHPLDYHNILLRSFNQRPHFISLEVVQLFMHGHHPIRIMKYIFYFERLKRRDK